MEKAELLESLNGLVASYEKHRQFIDKAKSQAELGKFKPEVVAKVIGEHQARCGEVSAQVGPLLPSLQGLVARLEGEKAQVAASKLGVDEQVQEFELRALIGEVTDDELESAVGALRGTIAEANDRIDVIDSDIAEITGALEGWAHLSGTPMPAMPVAPPPTPVAAPVPAPVPAPVAARPVAPPPPVEEEDGDDAVGAHVARTDIRDDVSVVFTSGVEAPRTLDDDIAIETGEVNDTASDGPSADVQFGFEEDILGGGGSGEVEIDLAVSNGVAEPAASEPASVEDTRTPDPSAEAPRSALLLYQEGTAEEQIYPFTGDTLTIGRGRENDIQIKNDSKVSRYHCKLFRRGNNFYIEDAKSSNGTLVNGELITDRRLFGGEEVIIGETFFRFRIME